MLRALLTTIMLLSVAFAAYGATTRTGLVTIDGPVNPVTADYLRRAIEQAPARGEELLLVEMDTPGGLDEAMRASVKAIMASRVPVVVYVAPSGARAASAGAVIALSADVCAMAPGTNIGAAHPVTLGEKPDKVMTEKVVNDAEAYIEGIAVKRGRNPELAKRMVRESLSLPAEKGLEGKVVDLLAADRAELLKKLEGRRLSRGGAEISLHTAGTQLVRHEMDVGEKILDAISNPNIAYILMMIGMLGLFFELSTPGAILPGTIGAISLILAFFAFQTLPVNFAGVLLILLALILFIAEIKIVSYGMLTVGGVISMTLGSLLLFRSPEPWLQLSRTLIAISVFAMTAFFVFAVNRGVKAHRRKPTTGIEGLVGESGIADSEISPEGKVVVHGEYWDAWSDERIAKGEHVVVTGVEGMRLKVRKEGARS